MANKKNTRDIGSTPISYNYNVQYAGPLDSRNTLLLDNDASLYSKAFWTNNKQNDIYLYPGMLTTVSNTSNGDIKGIFVLKHKTPIVVNRNYTDDVSLDNGIWKNILFSGNSKQVEYPLNWIYNDSSNDFATLMIGNSSNGNIDIATKESSGPIYRGLQMDDISSYISLRSKDSLVDSYIEVKLDNVNRELQLINGLNSIYLNDDKESENTYGIKLESPRRIDLSSGTGVLVNTVNVSIYTSDILSLVSTSDTLMSGNRLVTNYSSATYHDIYHIIYSDNFLVCGETTPDSDWLNRYNPYISTNKLKSISVVNKPLITISNGIKRILGQDSSSNAYISFYKNGDIVLDSHNNIILNSDKSIALKGPKSSIIADTSGLDIAYKDDRSVWIHNDVSSDTLPQFRINKDNIALHSNNINLWNSEILLPVPVNNKVELLRFNKNKLEWTDSALLKTATWSNGITQPVLVRIARAHTTYNAQVYKWQPSIALAINTSEGTSIYTAEIHPYSGQSSIIDFELCIHSERTISHKNTSRDEYPLLLGRIYYKTPDNANYIENNHQSNINITCDLFIYSKNTSNIVNWSFITNSNEWELTESASNANVDPNISKEDKLIFIFDTYNIDKNINSTIYTEKEELPLYVQSAIFTPSKDRVGQTNFREIPYPSKDDRGTFLKYDETTGFSWEAASMKSIPAAEEHNYYLIGTENPVAGKTILQGYWLNAIYYTNTGDMYALNYYATSDIRKKTDIQDISNNANSLQIKAFKWKDTSILSYGFIALDVEKTNPELVHTDDHGLKTVNYMSALSLYVAKLEKRISELENKLLQKES